MSTPFDEPTQVRVAVFKFGGGGKCNELVDSAHSDIIDDDDVTVNELKNIACLLDEGKRRKAIAAVRDLEAKGKKLHDLAFEYMVESDRSNFALVMRIGDEFDGRFKCEYLYRHFVGQFVKQYKKVFAYYEKSLINNTLGYLYFYPREVSKWNMRDLEIVRDGIKFHVSSSRSDGFKGSVEIVLWADLYNLTFTEDDGTVVNTVEGIYYDDLASVITEVLRDKYVSVSYLMPERILVCDRKLV